MFSFLDLTQYSMTLFLVIFWLSSKEKKVTTGLNAGKLELSSQERDLIADEWRAVLIDMQLRI